MRYLPAALVALLLWAVLNQATAAAQQPAAVRIALPSDDGSLTPYTFESNPGFVNLIYDTLTWRDARGTPRPWLASSVRRDRGGRSITVTLRKGARWHDGRPLTADDVAFTYHFVATHRSPRFTPQVRDIESVVAVGAGTVRFNLRRASLGFSDQPLADVPILPRHLWENLPRGQRAPPGLPVGSGPYRLVAHDVGRRYRLQANRRYFRGAPTVARIEVPIIRAPQARLDALRARRIDATPVSIPVGGQPTLGPGDQLAPGLSYNGTTMLFNVARSPFDRLAARKAVSLALDLGQVAGAGAGAGAVVAANRGVLHPSSPWALGHALHRFDPQAARVAVAEQGVRTIRVLVSNNDPLRSSVGRRVVDALARVGASARLVAMSAGKLDRALRSGAFEAAIVGFPTLASYDPSFLRAAFGDRSAAPLNYGRYRSARFDRLADRSAAATSQAARHRAVDDELRLLATELPSVPLSFGGTTFAYNPAAYHGWVDVRGSGILDKQSFLNGAAATPDRRRVGDPTDRSLGDSDDGFSLVPVIIAFAVLLLAGVAFWYRRRIRSGAGARGG